jgi:RNA polymerase sigma-70 factor (ECF subfamily)
VRTFLCAVARNLITDERRRLAVRARTHPVTETRSSEGPADLHQERILSSLDQLPPEQRETVLLKIYAGLTFEEVAKLTGVPAPTCASRYRYAIQKLSQLLGEE